MTYLCICAHAQGRNSQNFRPLLHNPLSSVRKHGDRGFQTLLPAFYKTSPLMHNHAIKSLSIPDPRSRWVQARTIQYGSTWSQWVASCNCPSSNICLRNSAHKRRYVVVVIRRVPSDCQRNLKNREVLWLYNARNLVGLRLAMSQKNRLWWDLSLVLHILLYIWWFDEKQQEKLIQSSPLFVCFFASWHAKLRM